MSKFSSIEGENYPKKYNGKMSESVIITLPVEYVSTVVRFEGDEEEGKTYTLSHSSGWTISAEICSDYYVWVEVFEAVHPTFGKVWGNFSITVYSEKEEGFKEFIKSHPPTTFDFDDI